MFPREGTFVMAAVETDIRSLFADKRELRRIIARQNEIMGFVPDPSATVERAQAMVAEDLRAAGIRPEDNDASCAIIAAREEH